MASTARSIPSRLTTRLQGRGEGAERMAPPADADEMGERLTRAASFLKRNPIPLTLDYDTPEVSGGDC